MEADQNHSIIGDRALSSGDEDRLGFREVAKRLAISLVDHASEDGLVIGIEGAWGSGKSSLLFLIEDEFRKLPEDRQPTVINFRPWLIGNRDALITSLFGELANKLDQVALSAGDVQPISVTKAKKAAEALRSFVGVLSKAGAAIEVAGNALGLASVELAGKGVKAAGELASGKQAPPPLSDLKDKLGKSLRELGQRFIITIDDVDRLEPAEVIEILRLVRSVIDLPNIIYLLCYDGEILAHSIEKAVGVKNGQSYLQKIVQLTAMVPKPEQLQLRQWFSDELHLIVSASDEDELSRLKTVIDYEGGRQLQTPRSVVRTLDSIRFFWPALREVKADLADFVWLQFIKDGNPNLYRWIEDYCSTAAVLSLGIARVEEAEKKQKLEALHNMVPPGHFDDLIYRHNFAEALPGVEADYSDDGNSFKIFQKISTRERDDNIQKRRLASPDHYKLYFALIGPSHALALDDVTSMWSAAEHSAEKAGDELLRLHNKHAAGSLTKADLLLDRISGSAYKILSSQQCENMLIALSQIMDTMYRSNPFDLFWVGSIWDRAQQPIPFLLLRLEPDHRGTVIEAMFREGLAIGWLTSLLRRETFSQGRIDERQRRPDGEWLFTNEELDLITKIMLNRYRMMSILDVFASPHPISLLFAWRQGGDEIGPRRLLESNIISDEGFIETLEHMMTIIDSSDLGRFKVLKKGNISPFMDFDTAKRRLFALEQQNGLGERAKLLAAALDDGDNY
ncbi:P-loop NTPase fold protein [Methylosinus sp. PW1]|uniref:KAP family P-loop NTPase fold protein n=1 Tax=Methylosinus sp. PW1 TaxID=107636 RepID=UPI0009FDCEF0|nr:P-loop NTPase fold protein [Methylosinus sp. PW1]